MAPTTRRLCFFALIAILSLLVSCRNADVHDSAEAYEASKPSRATTAPESGGDTVVVLNEDFRNKLRFFRDEETAQYMLPVELVELHRRMNPQQARSPSQRPPPRGSVGFIDTGVLWKHPVFQGRFVKAVDFTGEGAGDMNGHGTAVAAMYVMKVGDLSRQELFDIKAVTRSGYGNTANLIEAMEWSVQAFKEADVAILNISLGAYPDCNPSLEGAPKSCDDTELCRTANSLSAEHGIIVNAAVGNEPGRVACPACCSRVIGTGLQGVNIKGATVWWPGPQKAAGSP